MRDIKDIEAIYINPKWRKSTVGEFITKPGDGYSKMKKSAIMLQGMKRNFDPQKDKMDESSDDEEYRAHLAKSAQGGLTIQAFKKL